MVLSTRRRCVWRIFAICIYVNYEHIETISQQQKRCLKLPVESFWNQFMLNWLMRTSIHYCLDSCVITRMILNVYMSDWIQIEIAVCFCFGSHAFLKHFWASIFNEINLMMDCYTVSRMLKVNYTSIKDNNVASQPVNIFDARKPSWFRLPDWLFRTCNAKYNWKKLHVIATVLNVSKV